MPSGDTWLAKACSWHVAAVAYKELINPTVSVAEGVKGHCQRNTTVLLFGNNKVAYLLKQIDCSAVSVDKNKVSDSTSHQENKAGLREACKTSRRVHA